MKIQLLNIYGNNKFDVTEANCFFEPKSVDMFDVNIIDLRDEMIYRNSSGKIIYEYVDSMNDFISINEIIKNSKKTSFLFIYPSNLIFSTKYDKFTKIFYKKTRLKDIIRDVSNCLKVIHPFLEQSLYFERTETYLSEDISVEGDFYFNDNVSENADVILKSYKSDKVTCYKHKNLIFTTLDIKTNDELELLFQKIGLSSNKNIEIPDWMESLSFFDDAEQKDNIEKQNAIISEANSKISQSKEILDKNNKYKSILYTTGDDLVDVVKEIFSEIFDLDFSQFVDKKKEDIAFEYDSTTFIGEIKGINSNIKTSNLSQLDTHFSHFVEEKNIPENEQGNIKKLLVMNHQKNKPLYERDPVDAQQIRLAERKYEALIIETVELLKMYEKFVKGKLTTKECYNLLCETGILKIN